MKCEKIREMFADEWAGTLSSGDRPRLDSHLSECAVCRQEHESLNRLWNRLSAIPCEEPNPALRQRFHAMLEGYRRGLEPSHTAQTHHAGPGGFFAPILRLHPVFQVGLSIMLLAGGFIAGYVMRSARNGHEEMANLRAEVREMRQMVTISLLKQQSASERLKGVSWSSQVSRPDPEFLSTLIHTLNYDPNVDVRLAAVDALARFASYPAVRQDLVKSLTRQDSPLVQISLIDLLVQLHERQSIDVLKQLIDDTSQNPHVRDRAQWGLKMLS
jgi:hypothetical protein